MSDILVEVEEQGQVPVIEIVVNQDGGNSAAGTLLLIQQLYLQIMEIIDSAVDPETNPQNQIIPLGEIGAAAIEAFVNALDPVVNVQANFLRIFKALRSGSEVKYLYTGPGGDLGVGQEPATAGQFHLFSGAIPSFNGDNMLVTNPASQNEEIMLLNSVLSMLYQATQNGSSNTRPVKIIDTLETYTIQPSDLDKYLLIKNVDYIIIPLGLPDDTELVIVNMMLNSLYLEGEWFDDYEVEPNISNNVSISGPYSNIPWGARVILKRQIVDHYADEWVVSDTENYHSTIEYGNVAITMAQIEARITYLQNNVSRFFSYSFKNLCAHSWDDSIREKLKSNFPNPVSEVDIYEIEVVDMGFEPVLVEGDLDMYDHIEINRVADNAVTFRCYSSPSFEEGDEYQWSIMSQGVPPGSGPAASGSRLNNSNIWGVAQLPVSGTYTIYMRLWRSNSIVSPWTTGVDFTTGVDVIPEVVTGRDRKVFKIKDKGKGNWVADDLYVLVDESGDTGGGGVTMTEVEDYVTGEFTPKTEPSTLINGVVQFDKPRSYGAWNSPISFFNYFSETDAVLQTESVIYFNGSSLPSQLTGGTTARIGGNFVPGVVNKITAQYVSTISPRFAYTIEQRDPGTPVTLTYASTFALNMAIRAPQLMTLGGNITFNTPTNITPGAEISMVITGGAATHTVSFPAFAWMNGAPPSLPAGKNLVIWLFSKGTTVGDVIASYTMQT